ncbi:MAG: tRNA (adenosine(37)-N6)-dimethylallyltransferase MiaA [Dehalococcoidia bacterium]
MTQPPRPVLFVVGPTASGKTALAIALAARFDGEIVNGDSRQFYRGMDIGTAKPTPNEQSRAAHHLVDVAEPAEACGLAWFLDRAHAVIRTISDRERLPIVCGGTGQFIRALLEDWQVPRVPPDPALRSELESRLAVEGVASLVAELTRLDPMAAQRVDAMNPRRVMRAIEVARAAPSPAEPAAHRELLDQRLVLGIQVDRTVLYQRIDARVDAMFAGGLVEEVRALTADGRGCGNFAFNAIGYRQVCDFLAGNSTLEEARSRTKLATHRLARTQATWFRRSDPRITWLDAGPNLEAQALAVTAAFLRTTGYRE